MSPEYVLWQKARRTQLASSTSTDTLNSCSPAHDSHSNRQVSVFTATHVLGKQLQGKVTEGQGSGCRQEVHGKSVALQAAALDDQDENLKRGIIMLSSDLASDLASRDVTNRHQPSLCHPGTQQLKSRGLLALDNTINRRQRKLGTVTLHVKHSVMSLPSLLSSDPTPVSRADHSTTDLSHARARSSKWCPLRLRATASVEAPQEKQHWSQVSLNTPRHQSEAWSSLKAPLSKLAITDIDSTLRHSQRGVMASPSLEHSSCDKDLTRTINTESMARPSLVASCRSLSVRLHDPSTFRSPSRRHKICTKQAHVQQALCKASKELPALYSKYHKPHSSFPAAAEDRIKCAKNISFPSRTDLLKLKPPNLKNLMSPAKENGSASTTADSSRNKNTREPTLGDVVFADVRLSAPKSASSSNLEVPQAPPPSECSFHPPSHQGEEDRSHPMATITLTVEEEVEGEIITTTRPLSSSEECRETEAAVRPKLHPPEQHGLNERDGLSVPSYVHLYEGRPVLAERPRSPEMAEKDPRRSPTSRETNSVTSWQDPVMAEVISTEILNNRSHPTHQLQACQGQGADNVQHVKDKTQNQIFNVSCLPYSHVGKHRQAPAEKKHSEGKKKPPMHAVWERILINKSCSQYLTQPNADQFMPNRRGQAKDKPELVPNARMNSIHNILFVSPLAVQHKAKRF